VHGGVRVNVPACVCMCVPARVRPSRFTKLYINAARHILFLPHTHCSFYRTTRQNYIFSVRACAVASVLRAYTVACAIAWFCARVHWLRVCVRLSKFCVRTHGTVPTFIIEQIAVAVCNIFYLAPFFLCVNLFLNTRDGTTCWLFYAPPWSFLLRFLILF
jgi:hypothetical protein